GLPDGVPCFLFVGRMMWYKGQRIILDGLASMRERGYDFRMIFIGDGVDFDAISEYSRNLGLGDRVFFTGAIRDRELLRAYYSRADLFILPSVFDNNPIVCKEAAACATASVLIRDSSPAEGVTDGKNGMLIEEDPDSLASALEKIYSDPTLSRRLGDGALDDLYVSWEDMMKEVTARYAEIIAAAKNHDLRPRKKELSDVAVSLMSDTYTRLSNVREFFRNYI
ncbi:MAG: glycosyltransferase, partial [Clostridia bacterium]|nr:glycosyltransferase [Clostridia bacterium]